MARTKTKSNTKSKINANTVIETGIEGKVRVEHFYYQTDTFCAGVLEGIDLPIARYFITILPENPNISFSYKGRLEKDIYQIKANLVDNPKYGLQLDILEAVPDMALDLNGLIHYLAKNKEIKGIGEKKAEKIIELFGNDFETILMENPEKIAKEAGVKLAHIENLRKIWMSDNLTNKVRAHLSGFGFTGHQVEKLIKKYGNSAKEVIENNPYVLIDDLKGFGFATVDLMALKMGITKENPQRIQAGIINVISKALDEGHTWIEYNDTLEQANILLAMDWMDSKERIANEIDNLTFIRKIYLRETFNVKLLSLNSAFKAELHLFNIFNNSLHNEEIEVNPFFNPDEIADIDEKLATSNLNEQQKAATINFLCNRLSLISGGAGTGKTYTIKTILKICQDAGLSVAMAAPTGKAAKRMQQSTGEYAQTIHRLLEAQGDGQFNRNSVNPLSKDYDILILDEVSMMDVFLAERLFDATTSDMAILLVGDHNQLPPVGPGNILRDIITNEAIPTTILTEVVRQAGALKVNSNQILWGRVVPSVANGQSGQSEKENTSNTSNNGFPWVVFTKGNFSNDQQEIIKYIRAFYEVSFPRIGLHPLYDVQLLSPRKDGAIGVKNLNIILQELMHRIHFNNPIPPVEEGKKPPFYPGDKVIQTKNDYEIDVMNGEIGIVKKVLSDKLIITFEAPDGTPFDVEVSKGSNDLQLAYALTIHKSQGSEYPCVLVVIHKSHSFQHHRNLFYTAVTRASKHCIIIGDSWGIQNCAATEVVSNRRSWLQILYYEKKWEPKAKAEAKAEAKKEGQAA